MNYQPTKHATTLITQGYSDYTLCKPSLFVFCAHVFPIPKLMSPLQNRLFQYLWVYLWFAYVGILLSIQHTNFKVNCQ